MVKNQATRQDSAVLLALHGTPVRPASTPLQHLLNYFTAPDVASHTLLRRVAVVYRELAIY